MDSVNSQQTMGSTSQECKGWRDEINGNCIRFANKICRCNKKVGVKVPKSYDDPNKL